MQSKLSKDDVPKPLGTSCPLKILLLPSFPFPVFIYSNIAHQYGFYSQQCIRVYQATCQHIPGMHKSISTSYTFFPLPSFISYFLTPLSLSMLPIGTRASEEHARVEGHPHIIRG